MNEERASMPQLSRTDITVLQSSAELIDPHVLTDNRDRRSILYSIYESLVSRTAGGSYGPALAEAWAIENGCRTWTFRLRKNVSFHNGDRLTANDVVASVKRVCSPTMGGEMGTQGVYRDYLGDAVTKALDEHNVCIATKEPMADLLDLLVDIPIVPELAVNDLPESAVGSGPYRLLEADREHVEMEAFPHYWGSLPRARKVIWRGESDASRRVTRLLAREADIASGVTLEGKRVIENSDDAKVIASGTGTCIIFMCNAQSGACTDKRVRQALNYALDIPDLIEEVKGGAAEQLNGPLTPLHFGYDPSTPIYQHDPSLARKLLAEAGDDGGLSIALDVPTILPDEAPQLAKLMAAQYAKVGIIAEINEFSDRENYAQIARAKRIHDAACFDSTPLSTYRVLREKLHSRLRGPWWQGYTNPEVDALIDKTQATADPVRRQDVYRRAYRIIHDDAPWIFLYSPTSFWGLGPRAQGWVPATGGLIMLG